MLWLVFEESLYSFRGEPLFYHLFYLVLDCCGFLLHKTAINYLLGLLQVITLWWIVASNVCTTCKWFLKVFTNFFLKKILLCFLGNPTEEAKVSQTNQTKQKFDTREFVQFAIYTGIITVTCINLSVLSYLCMWHLSK